MDLLQEAAAAYGRTLTVAERREYEGGCAGYPADDVETALAYWLDCVTDAPPTPAELVALLARLGECNDASIDECIAAIHAAGGEPDEGTSRVTAD